MGRMICVAAVAFILAASSIVSADPPELSYIGVFKDDTHNTSPPANTVCPALYTQYEAWIWCLPGRDGVQCAEFTVSLPAAHVRTGLVKHPDIGVELGTIDGGMSFCFAQGKCKTDWVWFYHLTVMPLDPAPAKIDILPHPNYTTIRIGDCTCGYPIEPAIYLTPLYFCWTPDPGPLGAEKTSWGAIKDLF